MQPLYVQQLLKVLIEEYEDIDFMLSTLDSTSKRDAESIRQLLTVLGTKNRALMAHFEAAD